MESPALPLTSLKIDYSGILENLYTLKLLFAAANSPTGITERMEVSESEWGSSSFLDSDVLTKTAALGERFLQCKLKNNHKSVPFIPAWH